MKSKTAAILIVDDNPNEQILFTRALRKLGIPNPIRCVSSGNKAIAYLNGDGMYADRSGFPYPTFILTDLKMPDGDGFRLLEDLKANPDWAVIPTVVFSGSTDTDDIKKCFMLGASSYFVKPSTLDELQSMIKILYDYWNMGQTPETDDSGRQLHTESAGKMGDRFPQTPDPKRGRSTSQSDP
jgi:CheY-like chemotaxis protein